MKALPISPLAPDQLPQMADIAGLRLSVGRAGYAYQGRDDVLLARLAPGSVCAGVLTQSQTRSPEVDWCRAALSSGGKAGALWVNAGNSNAFTGSAGQSAVDTVLNSLADALTIARGSIYLASTGVIGEPLPADKAKAAIAQTTSLDSPANWEAAARAITTTDTFPKLASATIDTTNGPIKIAAIAKGSGMIAPDMATMLAFIFTDARISQANLQALMFDAASKSFNCTTVDGDTSTSDTFLAFATGQSGPKLTPGAPAYDDFSRALEAVSVDLAQQIVRDGEGARKFITVDVHGADSDLSARKIALSVANSPLVKTAIAGEDANWGRIVMAVGKAGARADRDRLQIAFGGHVVARDGQRVEGYDEAPIATHLKGSDINISIDLGLGGGTARIWTCDLTHQYIAINADYRS